MKLPNHLKYTFLGNNQTLPMIIAQNLKKEQEEERMRLKEEERMKEKKAEIMKIRVREPP